MPTTVPPAGQDVSAQSPLGDEGSLERIFREQYTTLVAEANAELADPPAASRVVERAFVGAWEGRAQFHTPAELSAFLHRAVHEGAVRERSRRAAVHRFEAHEGVRTHGRADAPPTPVDDAWAHVLSALHPPTRDREAVAHARADLSRHAAAEHAAALGKQRSWVPIIVGGAAMAVIIALGFWWLDRVGAEGAITRALEAPDVRAVSSRAGQRANTTLSDGTKVTLGADSKLTIPARYGEKVRAVRLDGTATFTPTAGQEPPFQVRAGNTAITATGTTFDVRAYPTDTAVTVRVREGQVAVKVGEQTQSLAAGRALAVNKDGTAREPSAAALQEALGWTDGRVALTGRPLRDALVEMRRWYSLDIGVSDSALLTRPVTMNADLESQREAIEAMESSAGVKFGYKEKAMILRDTADPAAQPKDKAQPKGKAAPKR